MEMKIVSMLKTANDEYKKKQRRLARKRTRNEINGEEETTGDDLVSVLYRVWKSYKNTFAAFFVRNPMLRFTRNVEVQTCKFLNFL